MNGESALARIAGGAASLVFAIAWLVGALDEGSAAQGARTVATADVDPDERFERAMDLHGRFAGLLVEAPRPLWFGEHSVCFEDGDRLVVVDVDQDPIRRYEGRREELLGNGAPVRVVAGRTPGTIVVLASGNGSIRRLRLDPSGAIVEAEQDGAADELSTDALVAPDARAVSWRGRAASSFLVRNASDVRIELVWIDTEGARHSYGWLAPGAERSQSSYLGHLFALVDEAGQDLAQLRVSRESGVVTFSEPIAPYDRQAHLEAYRAELAGENLVLLDRGGLTIRRGEDLERRSGGRRLAEGGEGVEFDGPAGSSPDKRHFTCLRVERAAPPAMHLIDSAPDRGLRPALQTLDYRRPGDALDRSIPVLVDVSTFEGAHIVPLDGIEELIGNAYSTSNARWRSDSSGFAFAVVERGHAATRVFHVDAETGKTTLVIDERSGTFVDYSSKQYLSRLSPDPDGSEDLLWMTERSGWNHIIRVDDRTGEVVSEVTSGPFVVKKVRHLDPVARTMTLVVCGVHPDQDPYHEHIARVDIESGELTLLTMGDGTHEVEFSPDGKWLIDRWSRVDHAPVVELRSCDGKRSIELGRASTEALEAAGWRPPERFVAKGRDGTTDIWGIVRRPTDFDPTQRYPVVESIYAGPHDAHVPKAFAVHAKAAELAELGFIVVQIDGMGTNWRSKAFHDVAWKNLEDAGFPDRIAWLRALGVHEPAADLERVGIYGGSAGGQNAMRALIDHHDVYKVAVADCGCHDNRVDKLWWNELWLSWPVGEAYERASNVVHAHRMRGDLLLIVGEVDRNVDPASTLQVVDALVRADKDFDLLVLPGVGHGAAETPYGTRRRRQFLVEKLLGAR